MSLPKNVDQASDPYFRIDEAADMNEIQSWLTWTSPAIYKVSVALANAKFDHDMAVREYDIEYGREYETSEESSTTTRREKAKVSENVLEKELARIKAKHEVRLAEARVEAIKEKAGCIRKIAHLRANITQFDEGDFAAKRDQQKHIKEQSHEEQPYNNQNFMPTNNFNANFPNNRNNFMQ